MSKTSIEAVLNAWAMENCRGEYVDPEGKFDISFWAEVALRELLVFFHEFVVPEHRGSFETCRDCAPWRDVMTKGIE